MVIVLSLWLAGVTVFLTAGYFAWDMLRSDVSCSASSRQDLDRVENEIATWSTDLRMGDHNFGCDSGGGFSRTFSGEVGGTRFRQSVDQHCDSATDARGLGVGGYPIVRKCRIEDISFYLGLLIRGAGPASPSDRGVIQIR